MGILIEGQVGPRVVQDGSNTELRQARLGSLVTTPAHAVGYEAVSRQKMFTVGTAMAGTTVVAANAAPPAAAAATILSLYNPPCSGVVAVMMKCVIGNISGTPGVGAFTYCVSYGNTISAAQNVTPRCMYYGGSAPLCRGYSQTALTGGLVHVVLRPIGHASFAGAIAATTPNMDFTDYLNGEIVIPQGGVLTIADCATGTSHVVWANFTWEEVPT